MGNSRHYSYFDKTPEYEAAEIAARQAKKGLWVEDSPVNPHEWRKSRRAHLRILKNFASGRRQ